MLPYCPVKKQITLVTNVIKSLYSKIKGIQPVSLLSHPTAWLRKASPKGIPCAAQRPERVEARRAYPAAQRPGRVDTRRCKAATCPVSFAWSSWRRVGQHVYPCKINPTEDPRSKRKINLPFRGLFLPFHFLKNK